MTMATLIFDLDGTLIDSAPSILAGFGHAVEAVGLAPVLPLSESLIGPPLRVTLARLSGLDPLADADRLAAMAAHFMRYYDSEGYRLSRVYPGVAAALAELHGAGVALHLATNKRYAPTALILDHLGWLPWFRSVYALDRPGLPAPYASKTAMVAGQLGNEGIGRAGTWYVGDRDEDREAAVANGLGFIGVDWGYGQFAADAAHPVLGAPSELAARLRQQD